MLYLAALILAVGSRHINGVLLGLAAIGSPYFDWLSMAFPESNEPISIPRQARIAAVAIVASVAVIGIEHCLVAWLCQRFNVIEQSTIGETLSDRIRHGSIYFPLKIRIDLVR